MKHKKLQALLIVSLLILISCGSSTKLLSSWKPSGEEPQRYNKLAVAVLFPNTSNRYITENSIVQNFKANGINAQSTYDLFPLAGKVGEMINVEEYKEELEKGVKQKIRDNNIDAIMIVSLFDVRKEQRYVEGSGFTIGGTGYYGTPGYMGSYYDYYYYSLGTVYKSGYYVEDITYFIECNLYDVSSEKLIWSGQTKTVKLKNIEEEAGKFAKIIVNELVSKKIIIP
jgi:hypothetical protein